MTHAARALQSHDLSGRELNYGSHTYFFDHTRYMEGLPGWVISPIPGPPPRQHKHERQYTPSTHPVILTRRIWNEYDNDGQMIFGDLGGPKVSWHVLQVRKNPEKKTSPMKLVPTGDRTRARCVTNAHATTCSTNLMILILCILDFENREHSKFQSNWCIS